MTPSTSSPDHRANPLARWHRALVWGLGVSGTAAARMLLEGGVEVVAVDRRSPEELDLEASGLGAVTVLPGGEPEELPEGLDAVVVSPGVPLGLPALRQARRQGLPVLAEVELAYRVLRHRSPDAPLVAITGSNGKSTTTALTGAMLRQAGWEVEVCGNIGTPLAEAVLSTRGRDPERQAFVVELSSFQLEGVEELRPRAAAFLNLAADHLDRHGSLEAYGEAKRRIAARQGAGDVTVLNADDPWSRETPSRGRVRLFSRRSPDRVEDGVVLDGAVLDGERVLEVAPGAEPVDLFRAGDSPLTGGPNLENAMAAALLARALGAEPAQLAEALRTFRGLPHRLERVAERAGVPWLDDSKGTNPAATLASLDGFADGSVHLILGGRNKGADLSEMAGPVSRKARRVYLIGEAADELAAALEGRVPLERSGTLEAAVASAARRATAGQVVLLSPACASFDQFDHFRHRGEVFQRLVAELPEAALASSGPGDLRPAGHETDGEAAHG